MTCVDITADGTKVCNRQYVECLIDLQLITGGLDRTMRIWDIGSGKLLGCYMFASDIYALACNPQSSFVTVGYVTVVLLHVVLMQQLEQ